MIFNDFARKPNFLQRSLYAYTYLDSILVNGQIGLLQLKRKIKLIKV